VEQLPVSRPPATIAVGAACPAARAGIRTTSGSISKSDPDSLVSAIIPEVVLLSIKGGGAA
jgi:hypothetical protein